MPTLSLEQKFYFRVLAQRACDVARIPHVKLDYCISAVKGAGHYDSDTNTIGLNEAMAVVHFKDFENIVIHEVAHAMDFVRHGNKYRRNGRGRIIHDKVFKGYMQELINQLSKEYSYLGTPSTYLQFTPKHSTKGKHRRWEYKCGCGKFFPIATVTHNRMQKGQKRHCKSCKGNITFTGKQL